MRITARRRGVVRDFAVILEVEDRPRTGLYVKISTKLRPQEFALVVGGKGEISGC
jgi:hypothetical protein